MFGDDSLTCGAGSARLSLGCWRGEGALAGGGEEVEEGSLGAAEVLGLVGVEVLVLPGDA